MQIFHHIINHKYFYIFITFILCFSALLVLSPPTYNYLSLEDHLIENLTAINLFSCGVLILIYGNKINGLSSKNTSTFFKILFYTIGVVFIVGAFEEISWGQRILGIETPEYLENINDQNELNFHNINKRFFDVLLDRINIAFVIVCTILLTLNKQFIYFIPLPKVELICAFMLVPFYIQYNNPSLDFFHLQYIALLVLFIHALKNKIYSNIVLVVITLIISFLIAVFHVRYNHLFPSHNNSANEYREFLFSLCCLFYAIFLFKQRNKISFKY